MSICVCLCVCVQYVWPGEPVIDIPGFDGQVTDIQVWDYPLRYREIINYMNTGAFRYEPIRVCVFVQSLRDQLKKNPNNPQ